MLRLFSILAQNVCTFVAIALFYLQMNMYSRCTVLTCIISALVLSITGGGGAGCSRFKKLYPKNLPHHNILDAIQILCILWLSIYGSQK
jgi:hypothetical protein